MCWSASQENRSNLKFIFNKRNVENFFLAFQLAKQFHDFLAHTCQHEGVVIHGAVYLFLMVLLSQPGYRRAIPLCYFAQTSPESCPPAPGWASLGSVKTQVRISRLKEGRQPHPGSRLLASWPTVFRAVDKHLTHICGEIFHRFIRLVSKVFLDGSQINRSLYEMKVLRVLEKREDNDGSRVDIIMINWDTVNTRIKESVAINDYSQTSLYVQPLNTDISLWGTLCLFRGKKALKFSLTSTRFKRKISMAPKCLVCFTAVQRCVTTQRTAVVHSPN